MKKFWPAILLVATLWGCQEASTPRPFDASRPFDVSSDTGVDEMAPLLAKGSQSTPRKRIKKLRLQKIGSFQEPVWLEEGAGGLLVVEKGGRIISLRKKERRVWLDISERVENSGEAGLLGLALSPEFPSDKLFYVYYTDKSGDQVLAEGTAEDTPRLRRTVLRMEDPAENHNGGQISFGPGGLYVATGDGGGSGDPERAAQNRNSLLGKILRINPLRGNPYEIPPDNPFAAGGGRPEIFALGLRNPWRFSFGAGRIWIGDVGQDEQEEISAPLLQRARGGNFGWSAWEGRLRFNQDERAPNPIWPVFVYNHKQGCSVTGGYWSDVPGPLFQRYLYGDFCTGEIRSFRLKNGRARGDRSEGIQVASLASFARGKTGKLWVISLDGPVYRLES